MKQLVLEMEDLSIEKDATIENILRDMGIPELPEKKVLNLPDGFAKKTAIGALIGGIAVTSILNINKIGHDAANMGKKLSLQNPNSTTESTTQKATPESTSMLGDVIYSPQVKFGVEAGQFKTASGHEAIGTLYERQSKAVRYTAVRPVLAGQKMTVITSDVKDGQFKESITYKGDNLKVYTPAEGKVFAVTSNSLQIEHTSGKFKYYTILKGVDFKSNFKVGDKIAQATYIGTSSGLDYSVAMNYDTQHKEFYNFVHPNEFVDIEKSDNFRYATSEYKAKGEPVIKAKIYTKTPYEELSKAEQNFIDKKQEALQQKLEKKLAALPAEVRKSIVASGLVIENEEQFSALESKNKDFYRDYIPAQYLENGTAHVSPQVEALRPMLMKELEKQGLVSYCDFLLAKIQQESGGDKKILATDPMQSSQSKTDNLGSISSPEESIHYGVMHFKRVMEGNHLFEPLAYGDARQAIHSYNFGERVSDIARKEGVPYSLTFMKEQGAVLSKEYYAKKHLERFKPNHDWRGAAAYGDVTYVSKIFSNFTPSSDWEKRAEKARNDARAVLEAKEKQELAQKVAAMQTSNAADKPQAITNTSTVDYKGKKLPFEVYQSYKNQSDKVAQQYFKEEDAIKKISSVYKKPTLQTPAPSNALKDETIVIDGGHGGDDSGAIGVDGVHEANNVKQTADYAEALFKSQGAKVIRLRKGYNDFITPVGRGKKIKEVNADIAISFHENASVNVSANRSETLYKEGDSASKQLAESMINTLGKSLPTVDKGQAVARDGLAILNASHRANKPTIIVEPYFVSNPYGAAISQTDNVRETVALSALYATYDYLGKEVPKAEVKKSESKHESVKETSSKKHEEKKKEVKHEDAKPEKDSTKKKEESKKPEIVKEEKPSKPVKEETKEPVKEEKPQEEVNVPVVDDSSKEVPDVKPETDKEEKPVDDTNESVDKDNNDTVKEETPNTEETSPTEKPVTDTDTNLDKPAEEKTSKDKLGDLISGMFGGSSDKEKDTSKKEESKKEVEPSVEDKNDNKEQEPVSMKSNNENDDILHHLILKAHSGQVG